MIQSIQPNYDRSPGRKVFGYAHPAYAESLAEFGLPRRLPESGGSVLERAVDGFDGRDAMGCYPLFACADWSKLQVDLEPLERDLICLSIVSDPFGEYTPEYLRQCFPDVTIPFKDHFIVDLRESPEKFVDSHHRRYARRALRNLEVTRIDNPSDCLDEWLSLYQELIARHHITGISAFSRTSLGMQLKVPGMVAMRARSDAETVGMLLWYAQDGRAYYHLGAYSNRGYDLRASFALFRYSLDYFAQQGFSWLNLGGGAGSASDAESGLTRFKRGWSTGTRTAYFCGRIFDRARYEQIAKAKGNNATDYFPAYRKGEFG